MDIDPDNSVDDGAREHDGDQAYGEPSRPTTRKRARRNEDASLEDEAHDEATPANLHPQDPTNFLKLCQAVRLLIGRNVKEQDLREADLLLRDYCQELVKVQTLTIYVF